MIKKFFIFLFCYLLIIQVVIGVIYEVFRITNSQMPKITTANIPILVINFIVYFIIFALFLSEFFKQK